MYADKLVKIINKAVDSFEYMPRDNNPQFEMPDKVLVVLPDFIGDIILLTPMLRNLRRNLDKSICIDLVGNRNIFNLVEMMPYHNNFFLKEEIASDRTLFLKEKSYDTIFLLNFPFKWAVSSYLAGIKQRIGFSLTRIGLNYPPIWQNLLTHIVSSTSITDQKPQWEVYLDILKSLDMQIYDQYQEVFIRKQDWNKPKKIIKDIDGPRVLIHLTAGSPGKQWDISNWSIILKYLREKFNCSIIATGTGEDKSLYDYLSESSNIPIFNLCGQTSIRETIALYSYIDLIITLDTAPAHFAAVAGIKNIIVIYGPTNEAQWVPYAPDANIQQVYLQLPCRPCLTRVCSHRSCLTKLGPEQVIQAINNVDLNTG